MKYIVLLLIFCCFNTIYSQEASTEQFNTPTENKQINSMVSNTSNVSSPNASAAEILDELSVSATADASVLDFSSDGENDDSTFSVPNVISPDQELEKEAKHEWFEDVDKINGQLFEKKYSEAIYLLKNLIADLRQQQRHKINAFFPKSFESFSETNDKGSLGSFVSQTEHFGVLFSKRYKRQENPNDTIEINVVFDDPSIGEYINVIKNPKYVEGFDNTKVVKIRNKYNALETFSEEEGYFERNILVNEQLLLNVLATGLVEKDSIDKFCDGIDILQLEGYLK